MLFYLYNLYGDTMGKRRRKVRIKYRRIVVLLLFIIVIAITFNYVNDADTRKLKNIGYTKEEIKYVKENKINKKILKRYSYISNLKA